MYQVKCVICGKEFVARVPHACYCSESCRKQGNKAIMQKSQREYRQRQKERRKAEKSAIVGYCKICGEAIKKGTGRYKYCSDHCADIGKALTTENYKKAHAKGTVDYQEKRYQKALTKTLKDIQKKSTLNKDLQALQQDGEKLGLKSYEYGKYARIKGL